MLMREEHPLKVWMPIVVIPRPILTDSKLEQSMKVRASNERTECGSSMLFKLVHPIKAQLLIHWRFFPRCTVSRLLHSANAFVPKVMVASGTTTFFRALHL